MMFSTRSRLEELRVGWNALPKALRLAIFAIIGFLLILMLTLLGVLLNREPMMQPAPTQLLTEPFLQLPTANSVQVVWFTEFAGSQHAVTYGAGLKQTAIASTVKLSRTREDRESHVGAQAETGQYQNIKLRDIWRHEAKVTGLSAGVRVPYRVSSVREDGTTVSSGEYTLASLPESGTPLKILLTSDHQLKPMTAANLQKVVETVGRVDGVFFAGDLINIPDRASEWFDDRRGGAFFPCLQGRAKYEIAKTVYRGGAIAQNAPIFPAIGNHEVMGRYGSGDSLGEEFENSIPRAIAKKLDSEQTETQTEQWLKDRSFNTNTYEEIFTLPETSLGGKTYYAITFGDVRLVVLYVTNMWRSYNHTPDVRGKYQERQQDLDRPEKWGYGQVIFGEIAKGSPQYNWLEAELKSQEFQQAKYKIVMFHHPPHSLGDNIVPAYTDPVQIRDRAADGSLKAVRYEYPRAADYIIRDVVPLLETAGVQLVFYGHSHLWNRFISNNGTHFLETSNVGNTYGAAVENKRRKVPPGNDEDYIALGDPNGLQPVVPTIAPLVGEDGEPQPYIASNDITVFSIFNTATGTISSYRFDTRSPGSDVVKFDEFAL
ncbi:metallophosphoesterase family protein [Chroococcidiopsis sp.]|uniref:metallophosphoesterase family protein n=1 Tax=Chroococcidiopsis sp. TaxID=3088168 RepID=UPI003F2CFA10